VSDRQLSISRRAIDDLIQAGHPIIYIQSSEEDRVLALLTEVARDADLGGVSVWSLTEGLRRDGKAVRMSADGPRAILEHAIEQKGPGILVLRDYHEWIAREPEIRRRLRDVYHACLNTQRYVVICSPAKVIPEEIERETAYLKLPLPDVNELADLVTAQSVALAGDEQNRPTEDQVQLLARALKGLTTNEARHALRFAWARRGKFDESVIPLLQEEKRLVVRRTGLMEYVPETVNLDGLGGLDALKTWLVRRRDLFFARDSITTEIVPRGFLLTGVSGCGKSLSAQAVASVFELPLYRVDMSQIFATGLGNAERLFAEACRTMEEVAPAVVWFDEIENSITRQHQDNSGVLDRIFGYFLTWMQERPKGLFVAATANRIDLLPAELIRKGRFDQVFFIDLPDQEERLEIFRIHLSRRSVNPDSLSLDLVTARTEGWTGAEIEQCVIAALTAARIDNKPMDDDYLFPALKEIVPLSRTMKEQVAQIRQWAFDRAVRASSKRR
jgi:hypothetical protein